MRGFSKVVLAGNLTRDPEMRATTTGSQACNFTIAVNRVYKGSDGNMQEQVSYIDCVAWGSQVRQLLSTRAKDPVLSFLDV